MQALGNVYASGTGVKRDRPQAFVLLIRSAATGNEQALQDAAKLRPERDKKEIQSATKKLRAMRIDPDSCMLSSRDPIRHKCREIVEFVPKTCSDSRYENAQTHPHRCARRSGRDSRIQAHSDGTPFIIAAGLFHA